VDGKIPERSGRALGSLLTRPALLARSDIAERTIPLVAAAIVQLLTCWADVAVAIRHVGKALRTIEGAPRSPNSIPGGHVRRDLPVHQPLQKLTIAIACIGSDGLRLPALPLDEASDHVLCGSRLLAQASAAAGAIHGFLEVRAEDGQVVASADSVQVVRGGRVTSRTIFHFKDGSIDDETTVSTQRHTIQLISDHHIQKGPSFPHPMDMMVDVQTGQVTVRTTGKDGKEEVKSDHLDLPADLANGLVPMVLQNLPPSTPVTTVSMVVATPKPRLVKLVISNVGEDKCFVAGSSRKAIHYDIKIDLGGIVGVVAPIVGKAPPDIQIWTIGGEATTFARERGPLYAEGPVMTIQLASPNWPDAPKSAH